MNPSHTARAIRANIRLGYDIDGNWAPPVVYLLFALAAPVSGVLMLVFMYMVILGESRDLSFLAFFLSGAAVFIYVRMGLQGAGYAVIEDREHFRMLRYLYIAPVPFPAQILGRVAVKILIGTVGVVATFVAGRYLLHLPFRSEGVLWGYFLSGLAGGLIGTVAIGLMLSSVMLLVDRMGWVWAEGIGGLLFLLSGAVIPLPVLPPLFGWIGQGLPISYWSELWRLSLYGDGVVRAMPHIPLEALGLRLWLCAGVWGAAALLTYLLCDRLARRTGRIERETFY